MSGGCEGDIRIWNVARGMPLYHIPKSPSNDFPGKCMQTLHAHLDYVTAVHFNREADLIVSCALDGLMYAPCPPSHHLFTHLCQSNLEHGWWTMPENTYRRTWRHLVCHHNCMSFSFTSPASQQVQFSPNSRYLLSTAHDSAIRLWDYHTNRCLKTYEGHVNNKYCISACFSVTRGKWIVAGSEDHKVYIWDLQTREIVQVLKGHSGKLGHDCFTFVFWCWYF